MGIDRKRMKLFGWGWTDTIYDHKGRDEAFYEQLSRTLEVDCTRVTMPPIPVENIELPPSKLDETDVVMLEAVVGERVTAHDAFERLAHAYGKSLHDLVRIRQGVVEAIPDAVVYPVTASEVASLIELARQRNWSLVPFGGGSSVVGGVEASDTDGRPVVTLDTTRLEGLVSIDLQSRTATFGAGTYGPAIEGELNPLGWSLGHYPQSFEFSTLGGWIAARSAGQQSNQYGRIEDLLVSCRMVSPVGELVTWDGPASAAGPDLKSFVTGSEGTLGVITEATVAIHPLAPYHRIQAVMFKNFEQGKDAVREIVQAGHKPSFMRLSDEGETSFYLDLTGTEGVKGLGLDVLAAMGYGKSKSVLLIGTEGEPKTVRREVAECIAICRRHKGLNLGTSPAKNWLHDRFHHPYLRDDLLDRGIATETLETSVTWDRILPMTHAVKKAIRQTLADSGRKGIVMAHLSHSYAVGSCVYFIFMYPLDASDPVGQWWPIKKAASDALARHGGTISHHHGVGLDHRDWMEGEKGALGISTLRSLQRHFDPDGVMNPGKLVHPK